MNLQPNIAIIKQVKDFFNCKYNKIGLSCDSIDENCFTKLYPLCNNKSHSEIDALCKRLERFKKRSVKIEEITKSKTKLDEWVQKNIIDQDEYLIEQQQQQQQQDEKPIVNVPTVTSKIVKNKVQQKSTTSRQKTIKDVNNYTLNHQKYLNMMTLLEKREIYNFMIMNEKDVDDFIQYEYKIASFVNPILISQQQQQQQSTNMENNIRKQDDYTGIVNDQNDTDTANEEQSLNENNRDGNKNWKKFKNTSLTKQQEEGKTIEDEEEFVNVIEEHDSGILLRVTLSLLVI